MEAVVDTNVLFAGLMSRRGASFQILSRIRDGELRPVITVPLLSEYDDVLSRKKLAEMLSPKEREQILDYLCSVGRLTEVFFLWRPILRDPKDDMVLEAAVASGAKRIITHNLRDFAGAERFGIRATTPADVIDPRRRTI